MAVRAWLGSLIVGMLVLSGCGGQRGASQSVDKQVGWAPFIARHTTGVVSRKADVHVMFTVDVEPPGAGSDVRRLLTVSPSLDGEVSLVGPRELVFEPKKSFEPGRIYTVRVDPHGLRNVPQNLTPFEFTFRVQTPQFEVSLQGLESDVASDQQMSLRGTLTSADAEEPAKLEQVMTGSFIGKPLTLQWTHAADGLTHTFIVRGIQRQREPQPLLVKWDGRPIAATTAGEQKLEVPARGKFLVTESQAVEVQGRKQILVYFSDNLDTRQDLTGFVRLSQGAFTTRIEKNTLTIYPDADLRGEVTLTLDTGIHNERGDRLDEQVQKTLVFTSTKPQVRFAGKGVILPDGKMLTIPFEAVSARAVHVTALRVYDDNMGQFLQVNKLDGSAEIGRVGRFLWRKTIPLSGAITGRWTRYNLDVTELMRKYPGGMFQLILQLTPQDSAYQCDSGEAPMEKDSALHDQEDGDQVQASNWDYAEDYFDAGDNNWSHRADPCHAAYYTYGENVRAVRNLVASNIGLLAKRDQHGKLLVTATDLRTSQPLAGVRLTLRNFQNQSLGTATTNGDGFATLTSTATPFLLVGETGDQHSYLKLNTGNALPTSHFDVGGETVAKGIKGFLYGDRGVWRPGDSIHITFVVQDKDGRLPANHPATLELYDPRGRLAQTLANTNPVGGFYRFDLKTAADAPTGDWTAKAILGELSYSTHLKVETVMPNRLKVGLDFGSETLGAGKPLHASVSAQWLSGATAGGLKADVKVSLAPTSTHFNRFTDYVFDDPARELATRSETIFEGSLDNNGQTSFDAPIQLSGSAPGMLSATFTTRVFERGGAFSINRDTTTYAPYPRFVGIRLPKGDSARDMLMTDQQHTVEIATLSAAGAPVAVHKIQVTLYKVEWKWWWDKTGDSLAQYAQGNSNTVVRDEAVETDAEGRGQWKFEIKYPEWGRYLVRACDTESGHCSGRTFYIDWPSWAGKEREQSGAAASVLAITADKPKYAVGETATIQLPQSAQGRALVTIENGTEILDSRWLEPKPGNTRFTVSITSAMTPNVYVAVTLIQPHENRNNDRPLRLYGVIPLEVSDPQTHLSPAIRSADEWKPESRGLVEVSEGHGHAMTYTLAVVDEGLLTLTNFKTPNPYDYFYKKEALGITTWDLFDDVAGAYSAALERLLALGGSDAAGQTNPDEARSRFPPVVRFLGPFHLEAGAKGSHEIDIPRYIGAVRVMIVAGEKGAYGSAEKSVFVRQPLMLLPTMPRVVGPGESVAVPVSVFVADPSIKDVALTIEPDSLFTPVGDSTTQVAFTRPEEKLGMLYVKAANRLGKSHVKLTATSGTHRAQSDIYIEVRSSNPPTTKFETHAVEPGESWTTRVVPHGLPGTNKATLEVSSLPALNLDNRLGYLIQYPHGCLEQTTSSVFPQLYLPSLVKLEAGRKQQIEDNVRNGIERLRWFQVSNGGFSYWPGGSGGFANGSLEGYELWASTYASHFLIEAEKAGYALPPAMKSNLVRYLKTAAQQWTANTGSTLDQAYRLYVLALAGEADVGAMNRLREEQHLATTERWILAASYKLAGLGDLAISLAKGDPLELDPRLPVRGPDYTFGSPLRDRAMVLQSLVTLGRLDRSEGLVKAIAAELSSLEWYSTQSVAYSLMAVAKIAGAGDPGTFTFEQSLGSPGGKVTSALSHSPVYQAALPNVPSDGEALTIHNTSQRVLFVTVASQSVPEAGNEDAGSSGLTLDVAYTDEEGKPVDIEHLTQGTDIIAHVDVKNSTSLGIDNIALTHIFPAGWEIHNDRMDNASTTGQRDALAPRATFPWGVPDGSHDATDAHVDYTDIRDDRVLQYFGLRAGDSIRFTTRLNAAYRGKYYLPGVLVEAMYDATKSAHTRGRWVEVAPAGAAGARAH
jgi:alpha-2-macroglobulin